VDVVFLASIHFAVLAGMSTSAEDAPMSDRPDKRSRKEMLARWKSDQRAAARVKLPLPDEQLRALFDMLDVEFPRQGCDHTLRLSRAWLVDRGLPVQPVVEWLQECGGYCDCMALANAEQVWLEAIRDQPPGGGC
jgi:hypothetical protein